MYPSMCGDVRRRTSTSVDVRSENGPLVVQRVYGVVAVAGRQRALGDGASAGAGRNETADDLRSTAIVRRDRDHVVREST